MDYLIVFLAGTTYKAQVNQFYSSYRSQEMRMVFLMVIGMSFLLFMIMWCIIAVFSKRITTPITVLTDYTNELKKKRSIEEKQTFVKRILSESIFEQAATIWKLKNQSSPSRVESATNTLSEELINREMEVD